MPIYEYVCPDCKNRFELMRPISQVQRTGAMSRYANNRPTGRYHFLLVVPAVNSVRLPLSPVVAVVVLLAAAVVAAPAIIDEVINHVNPNRSQTYGHRQSSPPRR